MSNTTTRRRRSSRLTGSVNPFPPRLVGLATEPVAEASAAYAASLDRHREARQTLAAARRALEAAGPEDRHAATAAEVAGKPSPKPKATAAQEAVAKAEREATAARDAAELAMNSYLEAVRADMEAMQAAARREEEATAEDAKAAVGEIEAALVRRAAAGKLLRELGDGSFLGGRSPIFAIGDGRRPRDPLAREMRQQVDSLREALGVEVGEAEQVEHGTAAWQ